MKLIFLHIPKAGGNSLFEFMAPNFEPRGHFDVSLGLDYVKRINELETLDEKAKEELTFIYGHVPFGLHETLPGEWKYCTMLRDPIDRVVSHYYYVLEQETHPLHQQVKGNGWTLVDYVKSGITSEVNNGMTRLLGGRREQDSLHGHANCTEQDFEDAKRHLIDEFCVVGLLERFAESQELFAKVFNWNYLGVEKKNVTKRRRSLKDLSFEERSVIIDYNSFDLELYQLAQRRFSIDCRRQNIRRFSFFRDFVLPLDELLKKEIGSLMRRFDHRIKRVSSWVLKDKDPE